MVSQARKVANFQSLKDHGVLLVTFTSRFASEGYPARPGAKVVKIRLTAPRTGEVVDSIETTDAYGAAASVACRNMFAGEIRLAPISGVPGNVVAAASLAD